ncbi:hypothetical protein [Streptomyces sp. ISL-94]|uniref:hypothetical protein n=1 Tax=Streptomyces sp. ISL-94 TaxID=2819190 RepID=UPI001BE76D3B|nr:hypothetical protein [Streptomyces sp. ISL-94]MBT2479608.1 hypothetical protein [Streptomyces sp. ISL-94]
MALLYVTDLAYPARGRRYCDEDIFLTSRLRAHFPIALCHPADAEALMPGFEAVVVRNSGPVLHYQEAYDSFRAAALAAGIRVYNPLTGRGDMAGKQYLLDLTAAGYPVIPTVDDPARLSELPQVPSYAVKPKQGADSIGLAFTADPSGPAGEILIQPRIDFAYEVSFYFVDDAFQYALYAPDPERRWELRPYDPTGADLAFARTFIEWNTLTHGIQRVDACRAPSGELLLVELEDLNPYLSLDLLPAETQDDFVTALTGSLRSFLS